MSEIISLALEQTDALLYDLFGLAPSAKAAPSSLTDAGFDALVLGVLKELKAKTKTPQGRSLAAFLRVLDVDWTKLTPEARSWRFRNAAKSMLGFTDDVAGAVAAVAARQGPTIIRGVKEDANERDRLSVHPDFNAVDERMVLAAATQQALFARDEFGKRSEYLSAKARNVVANGLEAGLDRYDIAALMKAEIGEAAEKRADAYWQVVASAFTGRARTFGHLSAMRDAGVEAYEVEAVLDEVTSEVCRFMHGKRFSVGSAISRHEEVMAAEDPEEVKNLQPWMSVGKGPDGQLGIFYKTDAGRRLVARVDQPGRGVKDRVGTYSGGMGSDLMQRAGLTSPPYHGHCRTTVVPVFGTATSAPGDGGTAAPPEAAPKPPPGKTPRKPREPKKPAPEAKPEPPPPAGKPGAVTPPALRVVGPPGAGGLPSFADEGGNPVGADGIPERDLQVVRDLYAAGSRHAAQQLAGLGPTAEFVGLDVAQVEAALRAASGGKDPDLRALAGLRAYAVDKGELKNVVARGPLDLDKAAAYAARPGTRLAARPDTQTEADGYPIAVRYKGKVLLYEGAEKLVADRLRMDRGPEWGRGDPTYVRLVDLDDLARRGPAHPLGKPLDAEAKRGVGRRIAEGLAAGSADGQLKVREAVRDVLRSHGVVPRDEDRRYENEIGLFDRVTKPPDAVTVTTPKVLGGAAATHDWNGRVKVQATYAANAADAAKKLAADADVYASAKWDDMIKDVAGVHTLIHEELHGASRALGSSYQGVGVGMEEAATEILARKFTRELFGHKLTRSADAQDVVMGLPVKHPLSDRYLHSNGNTYAYGKYIDGLFTETAKEAGHADVHAKVEGALLRMRQGSVDDQMWVKGEDQIAAYVSELGLPKAAGKRLAAALSAATSPLRDTP